MLIEILDLFVLIYPAIMALYYSISAMTYFLFFERKDDDHLLTTLTKDNAPLVSIMVPCYNEGDNLGDAIPHLLNLNYPNYELIFINDGSKDNTGTIIDQWAALDNRIVTLHQVNQGKATALNNALVVAKGKYVACIDGDAVLDYDALIYMVQALETSSNLGAVTGNPRVRNRSTILGKLQVSEFSAIIGLIKRAQGLTGTIFTVSGVFCLFRTDVIRQVGGWSTNMITEDVDISWKLQTLGYDIDYEPRALCWVLMPERFNGLFKQRLRWAQGGAEVIMKYFPVIWTLKNRRLWPIFVEYFTTAFWAICLVIVTLIGIYSILIESDINTPIQLKASLSILFFTFFLQCILSLIIDSRYEKGLIRYTLYCIWYPWFYWLLNTITLLIGIPKAIFRNKHKLAVWTSPDRGV